MFNLEASFMHEVTHKVKVDLNMFHARMIDWVKTEMCGSEVITKQLGRFCDWKC